MKKVIKGGLVFAVLMAGSAQASLVNIDLTGTVQNSNGYAYGTNGINNGDSVNFSFTLDTSTLPSYGYSYPGYYSYTQTDYSNAIKSVSANAGGNSFSFNSDAGGYIYGYAENYNWYGNQYNYVDIYAQSYNGYTNQYLELYRSGNGSINTEDLASALLGGGNGLSFWLYSYNWNNEGGYSYVDYWGTLSNLSVATPSSSPSAVPVPAAVWLFGSAFMGLLGATKRKFMPSAMTA